MKYRHFPSLKQLAEKLAQACAVGDLLVPRFLVRSRATQVSIASPLVLALPLGLVSLVGVAMLMELNWVGGLEAEERTAQQDFRGEKTPAEGATHERPSPVDEQLPVEDPLTPDNQLTAAEKADGWQLLFDGSSTRGWMSPDGKPLEARHVQEGALNPHPCNYMLVYERPLDDCELKLDFKISARCNSGVFLRTFPLEPRPGKDVGFNGIEVAIDDTPSAGYHDTGAFYDLLAPRRNAMRPVGSWNHLAIACQGGHITIELNGERVNEIQLDEWTTPNRRPDGSEHKFDVAYRDHPRQGYFGLQDHGSNCWYKNVKLRDLSP